MRPIIKPLGIGDLKVVKQKLARYEAGEVAHIENVMAQETRKRTHRHLRQYEEITVLEEERIEENLRDLQSTERFELQTESQRTIKTDVSFQAGLDVSASYGPVSLTAFAKFAMSNSQEESDRNSTKFAKDVTDKSLSRLVERVKRERRTRTLDESEETNKHGFEPADEHNVGLYRWVDKYYRCKVVNYGKRLMYEFFVPEPAAFYIFATQYNLNTKILPTKPDEPTSPGSTQPLKPSDITRYNYLALVQENDAQGVNPPPPEYIRIAKALHRETPTSDHWAFSNEDFKIPKGYLAVSGSYVIQYAWQSNGNRSGVVQVGLSRIDIGSYPSLSFGSESTFIPVSGNGYNIRSWALNIETWCRLMPEYYDKWKLETYNAIMAAYRNALMDYEERVAAAQIQQGVAIGGNNPGINREIEREELKRSCLTLWTLEQFNLPWGIDQLPTAAIPGNYPEINVLNAISNSPLIEFFEHAFDWRNITYEFLPTVYGRKPKWVDLMSSTSPDPIFATFLKAGAARVVVPVNLAYTQAVLYYQLTGIIPMSNSVPPLSSVVDPDAALFNSYVDELVDVEDLPDIDRDVEIDEDDPETWLLKLPTTLVWLQGDATLPDFEA